MDDYLAGWLTGIKARRMWNTMGGIAGVGDYFKISLHGQKFSSSATNDALVYFHSQF